MPDKPSDYNRDDKDPRNRETSTPPHDDHNFENPDGFPPHSTEESRPVPPPYSGSRARRPVAYTAGRGRRPIDDTGRPPNPAGGYDRPPSPADGYDKPPRPADSYARPSRTDYDRPRAAAGPDRPCPSDSYRRPVDAARPPRHADDRPPHRADDTSRPSPSRLADPSRKPHPQGDYSRRRPAPSPKAYSETYPDPHSDEYAEPDERIEDNEYDDAPLHDRGGRRPARRARRRSQFAAMYIFIIVISVGICLTAFAVAFPRIFNPDREPRATAATPTPTPSPTPLPLNARNLTGLITNISGQNISMLDIAENRARHFIVQEDTQLANRFGQDINFDNVFVGNLMDITYDPDTNALFSLRQAVTRDITPSDFRVDMDDSTITVGNDVFNFTQQTLVLRRGAPFDIGNISSEDSVTLITLGDMVWTIDIASDNGFLQFTNTEDIVDGRVIMNPIGPGINRFADLEDTITLPEGEWRVTVEGRNIEPYITEITIVYSQTVTIDLAEVEPSAAVLELTVTPAGSRVYINDELTSAHAELEFAHGEEVEIRVERDGYYTDTRTITMDQAIVSINITLQEETPEPETATLIIATSPSGAQIWLDGQFVSFSPMTLEVQLGHIDIRVTTAGYYDYTTSMYIIPGDNHRSIFMTPESEYVPTPPPHEPYDPPYDPYHNDNDDDNYGGY